MRFRVHLGALLEQFWMNFVYILGAKMVPKSMQNRVKSCSKAECTRRKPKKGSKSRRHGLARRHFAILLPRLADFPDFSALPPWRLGDMDSQDSQTDTQTDILMGTFRQVSRESWSPLKINFLKDFGFCQDARDKSKSRPRRLAKSHKVRS